MKTKQEITLEILPNLSIQVLIQTIYYKANGQELTREKWRGAYQKGDMASIQEVISDSKLLNIIQVAWAE